MSKPFFSIILPSYKVEEYLESAVSSILNQTFNDYEIIIVDDASPDSVGAVADCLCEKHPFIKAVHHQTNLGLSEARNSGLRSASGEFVFFMDPDDVIESNLLETVKLSLDSQPSDVVVFGVIEEYFNNKNQLCNSVTITHAQKPLFLNTKEEVRREMIYLEKNTLLGYAWNKVYRRDYLISNRLEFETVEFIEDIDFNLKVFCDLSSLIILDAPLYHYIKRVNAGLTSKYSESFYAVHRKRVEMLFSQYKNWDMLTDDVYGILASEFARFVFSSAQRNCSKQSGMNDKMRRDFIRSVYGDEIYKVLIPKADSNSKSVKLMLYLLKRKSVHLTALVCRMLYIIKTVFPVFFSKIKQER
ncbi:MAG: glycosyltransferase family 2 protein [Clostridia bacterium]|nr:glycosyltransferase family 2 protein [Clostridia bacterium]